MININLFGGPGTGKSTTASGVFYHMKTQGAKIEYIQEYAKELTFGKDFTKLSDQLLILGEQHHRMFRLDGQLDFLVHDSPFVMGLVYLQEGEHLPKAEYKALVLKMFNSYNNINIFLTRNIDEHGYQEYGRGQTLQEAEQKDAEIKALLDEEGIPYIEVQMGQNSVQDVINALREHTKPKTKRELPKYCTVTIADVKEYKGGEFESGWKMNCQLVTDTDGNEFINTPYVSGDTFKVGEVVSVGFGNTFGTSGKKYKTINKN